jgi:hypothetical protein
LAHFVSDVVVSILHTLQYVLIALVDVVVPDKPDFCRERTNAVFHTQTKTVAMKTYSRLLALCLFHANVCGTTAFSMMKAAKASLVLRSSPSDDAGASPVPVETFSEKSLVAPTFGKMERIEGGGRVQTYPLPYWAERCQMMFTTMGRPMKANIELMLGPLRTTHQLKLDCEDGSITPYQATLKFKKNQGAGQVLRITTKEAVCPIWFGLLVPEPERSDAIGANTQKVWDLSDKQIIQGGTTGGASGARRYWTIPPNVKSVQVLLWSIDTGKKSLKVTLDVLQGQNNIKQKIFIQCGGGSQPYHSVIQVTPEGGMIGVRNEKFMEDGKMEIAFVPFEYF